MTDGAQSGALSLSTILRGFVPISGGVYLLFLSIFSWQKRVNEIVPEAYLDEFFHIRQAQNYCKGDWTWDPKITTPPGLYVFSWLWNRTPVVGPSCDIASLRSHNLLFIGITLIPIAFGPNSLFWPNALANPFSANSLIAKSHLALNVAFFPVLWFFSGLYYTDIASTAFVVMTLSSFFLAQSEGYAFMQQLDVFLRGLAALTFRQTNVFWVAVFPAGLTLLEQLRRRSIGVHTSTTGRSFFEAFVDRKLYEQGVGEASATDYLTTAISLALNTISYVQQILADPRTLRDFVTKFWPSLSLLATFVGFVVVNGGVVLGDKTNHVPEVHLPQVFYLVAYIAFFDLPVIYPQLVSLVLPTTQVPSFIETWTSTRPIRISIGIVLATALASLLFVPIIYFNTIIHPFLLADNRHYTFYVFRILRLYPMVKYALAPIYALAAWAVIQALGQPSQYSVIKPEEANEPSNGSIQIDRDNEARKSQVTTAWVLLWVLTSALCLVTAPLVEPRYYIIPWLIWRWHVPGATSEYGSRRVSTSRYWHGDHRLLLETAWFALINGVTAYMFLYKPFKWIQEPLSQQRFMW